MKKQFKIFVAIIMIFVLSISSVAFSEDVQVPVLIDGVRVAFFDQDGNLLQQKKVDDIVYVPLLSLCESMGMEAQVQGQSVSVNGMRIGMFDASGSFLSPVQFDGTDYVPLLAFCEATGVSAIEENGKLIISRAKQETTVSIPQDMKGKVALHPYNFGDYFAYDIRVDEGSFKTVQTRIQVSDGFIYSNDSEVDFVLTCDARSVFEIEDISFDVYGTVYEASAQLSGINSIGFYEDMPASGTLTRTKHETGISITPYKPDIPKLKSVTLGDVSGYVILPAEKAETANNASYIAGERYLEYGNYKAAKEIFDALSQLGYSDAKGKYLEAEEREEASIKQRREESYQNAVRLQDNHEYENAATIYRELGNYKDCSERIVACEDAQRRMEYQKALSAEEAKDYETAIVIYEKLGMYEDCPARLALCKEQNNETRYQTALSLEENQDYENAIVIFEELGQYKDSYERKNAIQRDLSYRFDDIGAISDGFVSVKKNGKWGFANLKGRLVIPCIYDTVGGFHDGLAAVVNNGKCGFVDENGVLKIQYQYNRVGNFGGGVAWVALDGRFGFIDRNGNTVLPFSYEDAKGTFENDIVAVKQNSKWFFIDKTGTSVSENSFDAVPSTWSGQWPCPVLKADKNGFVNEKGELFIECEYEEVNWFANGYTSVMKDGKYGFIDQNGILVTPYKYDSVYGTVSENGLVVVKYNGKWGVVGVSGEVVIPIEREMAYYPFSNGLASIYDSKTEKRGFVDSTGSVVIPCQYDDIYLNEFVDGFAIVKRNNKWGIIDLEGKEVVPCNYNEILYKEGNFVLLAEGKLTSLNCEEMQPDYYEKKMVLDQRLAEEKAERVAKIIPSSGENDSEKLAGSLSNLYKTLQPGCDSQAVLNARMKLYELGYFKNKPTQTEYTNAMKDYVKKFEKDFGLERDGILSPEDQAVLFSQ